METDYDAAGRPVTSTRAYVAGASTLCSGTCTGTASTFDALGRVLTATDAAGGTVNFTYTKNDKYQSVGPIPTGENAKRKQSEYNALGQLTSVCEVTSGTGSGNCGQTATQTGYWTKYIYDTLGNLTVVTQNAQAAVPSQQTRSYVYDMVGRPTSETSPESGTVTYVYDTLSADASCGTVTSAGQLLKQVDAIGNVTCYTYDALHRAASITYPTGTYSTSTDKKFFVYDASTASGFTLSNTKGHIVEAYTCPPTGSCTTKKTDTVFSYSARGEVTDIWQSTPHSSGYYHLAASYWAHGALNSLAGVPGLPTIYYGASDGSGLDGEGRITKVTASTGQNPITGVTYTTSGTSQPIGSLTQATYGSADSDNFSYDPASGRITQYKFNVGTTPQIVTGNLTWNANGTLQTLATTDPLNSANTQTCNYTHDDLARTVAANCGAAWSQTFTFDPFGNINKTGSSSFLPTYNVATNRYSSIPGGTPTYDANGNLTYDLTHNYTWDVEAKAVTIDTVGLTYDALGRMVEQARGSSYTQIVYGPRGGKLALMSAQTLSKAFVSLPGGATAVYNASGLQYYRHSDWLGSARLATTPSRTLYFDGAYAPYGEDYAKTGTADLSFTGQNQDTVSGMYDFMFRSYSPVQGRWVSPDPAGLSAVSLANPQSWNRYAYVSGQPLEMTDPLGLQQSSAPPLYKSTGGSCDVGCIQGGGGDTELGMLRGHP